MHSGLCYIDGAQKVTVRDTVRSCNVKSLTFRLSSGVYIFIRTSQATFSMLSFYRLIWRVLAATKAFTTSSQFYLATSVWIDIIVKLFNRSDWDSIIHLSPSSKLNRRPYVYPKPLLCSYQITHRPLSKEPIRNVNGLKTSVSDTHQSLYVYANYFYPWWWCGGEDTAAGM